MKSYKLFRVSLFAALVFSLVTSACQKLDRPVMGEIIPDPLPPELQILGSKSYWHFDGNARDTGEYKLATTLKSVSFVPGVTVVPDVTAGEAAQIGPGGYLVATNLPDELKSPGSFSPFCTLSLPGYNLLLYKLVTSAGVKALVKILNWSRAPLNDLAQVSAP